MLVIGLWLLAVSQRRRALYPVAMAVFGLATYACDAAWYVLPPFVLLLTVYALVSRRVAPRAALPGAALYLLLALPALLTLAVNTLDLPGFTLLGVQIPRFDAFEHAGKGPFAPYDALIRGSDAFDAMMDNGFSFVRQTLLQLPEEENVTSDLFAMPNFGLYQLFLLPVAVLGGVAYLVRLARERGRAALPRNVIGVLAADGQDGAWSLPCVACALLLVCMAGYGILFRGLNAGHLSMVLPLLIQLCAQGVYIHRAARAVGRRAAVRRLCAGLCPVPWRVLCRVCPCAHRDDALQRLQGGGRLCLHTRRGRGACHLQRLPA